MHIEGKTYKREILVDINYGCYLLFSVRLHRPNTQVKGGRPNNLFDLFKAELSPINKFNKLR